MDTCKEQESETSPTGVFELSGEPAIVINGVPNVPPSDNIPIHGDSLSDTKSMRDTGFGKWLEGREVRKLFGDQFYSGKVMKFDKETGWYRVVYEDGDFEDLEWHELEEVLQPLDITVPLKTIALKIIKKYEKSVSKSGRNVARSRNHRGKDVSSKGNTIEGIQNASVTKYRVGLLTRDGLIWPNMVQEISRSADKWSCSDLEADEQENNRIRGFSFCSSRVLIGLFSGRVIMAIVKNNFGVSRLDGEVSPGNRDSVSSDEDELQRQSSESESDGDDEDDDVDDSGAGSDDFDLSELGEAGAEFCQVGKQTCSIPFELYDLPNLSEVLTLDSWNDCLTEEERFSLAEYLPDMDQETFMRTLKELFSCSNFHLEAPLSSSLIC
ncbi:hypothetical protein HHK36_018322 [Tetracentron sinense]|uniref:DEUBAD domain-containing protein n=1 Tax=Tetracentron sinense TaxID=13715 RepID=A0A834YYB5_TETSI|nr:hypothetical protein HHK36_018322 [Tetracentron sinense]